VHLEKLTLYNFKNYEDASLGLSAEVNCFFGLNGSGKTNLLDAIYYLSLTKSASPASDLQNIRQGESQFFIKGQFLIKKNQTEVLCSFIQGSKKLMSEDGNEYKKMAEHIGKYPLVLIAPNDIELIWDGSEQRRKFFDGLLSQMDHTYLENLITYTQLLRQRNGMLKLFSERGSVDQDLLDSYDDALIPAANFIHATRKSFLTKYHPLFEKWYKQLAGKEATENVSIGYRSDLEEVDYADLLKKNLQRDILLQRTTSGIHRDDFLFSLNTGELKKFGSQGQQKSFLIGLKLAEFQMLAQATKKKPLLLLDDIFDKLDDTRIIKLMSLISDGNFGQIFITDARSGRSREILKEAGVKARIFEVENGKVVVSTLVFSS
jgi:DNA replication and repair protein RecF